jgi:hypothetical protein
MRKYYLIILIFLFTFSCSKKNKEFEISYVDFFSYNYDDEIELNANLKLKNFSSEKQNDYDNLKANVKVIINLYKIISSNDSVLIDSKEQTEIFFLDDQDEEINLEAQFILPNLDSIELAASIKAIDLLSNKVATKNKRIRL